LAVPTLAQVRDPTLSDFEQAGSVIVFPKFVQGVLTVDGVVTPRTEIELSAVCPTGAPFFGTCPEHQEIKVRFHWVCPGARGICRETDFNVFLTVDGTAVFNPDNIAIPGSVPIRVPVAPCPSGYLIGWVIDASDRPIKYDGLIGDAVLRNSGTAVTSYNAITIQADPALANLAPIATGNDPLTGESTLLFDGGAGHYLAVTGRVVADVTYDNPVGPASFSSTSLIALTLNVRSNRPNYPTFLGLDFWNENEVLVSTSLDFICWGEAGLSDIDGNLTQQAMGTRKGVVQSGLAFKVPSGGVNDIAGPVTLLGLVQTNEGPAPGSMTRSIVRRKPPRFLPTDGSLPLGQFFPGGGPLGGGAP
jgi:hypothetical protein